MRVKKTQAVKELAHFLRNRSRWDIITMLRGPDFGVSPELKYLTVGRIRAVAGITESQGSKLRATVNTTPLTFAERERRDYLLDKAHNTHFYHHYNVAVAALRSVAKYDLSIETPVKRIRKQHGKLS